MIPFEKDSIIAGYLDSIRLNKGDDTAQMQFYAGLIQRVLDVEKTKIPIYLDEAKILYENTTEDLAKGGYQRIRYFLHYVKGEYDEAIEATKKSQKHYKDSGRIDYEAMAYADYLQLVGSIGRIEEAEVGAIEILERFEKLDIPGCEISILHAHNSLGRIYREKNKPEKAVYHFKKMLKAKDLDYQAYFRPMALRGIAQIYKEQGKHNEAIAVFLPLLQEAESLGDLIVITELNCNIGDIFRDVKDTLNAAKYYNRCIEVADSGYSASWKIEARIRLSEMLIAFNNNEQAERLLDEAKIISQKEKGATPANVAGVYHRQNSIDKACSALKEALRIRISRLGNDHVEVATTLFGMGIIYCDKGDLQRAMDCYEASLNIRMRKIGTSSIEVAQTEHNIGSLYAMQQDYSKALLHWKSALEKYRVTLRDDHHMVACTIGNIQMAENVLAET
jgi:tetratricopeptide (TPR) repeat protein